MDGRRRAVQAVMCLIHKTEMLDRVGDVELLTIQAGVTSIRKKSN